LVPEGAGARARREASRCREDDRRGLLLREDYGEAALQIRRRRVRAESEKGQRR
jgi:hypothetical protein